MNGPTPSLSRSILYVHFNKLAGVQSVALLRSSTYPVQFSPNASVGAFVQVRSTGLTLSVILMI